jgi:hypothetical protein
MIEIMIKLDPKTGNIMHGHTENAPLIQLIGMLEVTKNLLQQQHVKPATPSPIIQARPGLST